MDKSLAAWRAFQDTVVRHPLCRYTVLPAGILAAILLVALAVAAGAWCLMGWDAYSFADGISIRDSEGYFCLAVLTVLLAGAALTGRWLPVLIGLLPTFFAWITYDSNWFPGSAHRGLYDLPFMWQRLGVFVPVLLWLLYLDRKAERRPALPRRLAWLVAGAGMLLVGMVAALLVIKNYWIQAGLLQALSAAFWFTVFFDLAWRFSPDPAGRSLRGLLAIPSLAVLVFLAVDCGLHDFANEHGFMSWLAWGLASVAGQWLSHRLPDRDAEIF